MPPAISNTSPLLYLYRAGIIDWLSQLFTEVWTPGAVIEELAEGRRRGYDVPTLDVLGWIEVVEPESMPHEWLALDLGAGELATMALALENPGRVVLLDDLFARRTAQAAGLTVWGTLRILLEGKKQGLTDRVEPIVMQLSAAGMWISDDVRRRVLKLAGEEGT